MILPHQMYMSIPGGPSSLLCANENPSKRSRAPDTFWLLNPNSSWRRIPSIQTFMAPSLLDAVVGGRLEQADVRWNPKPAVTVVLASGGYPGAYEKGKVIEGLDAIARLDYVHVFHAGTEQDHGRTFSTGGRVLAVTALGSDIADARYRAYRATEMIRFEGAFFRSDIAHRAIARDAVSPPVAPR